MTDIVFILGTRPEIIKLSPLIRECESRAVDYSILHTGQHYSEYLNEVFFTQLELPEPDVNLEVGSGPHGQQTGQMVIGIEETLLSFEPDYVLVQGDTNSVLAGSIATSKLDAELGHIEAGLRSFNKSMPEETNRIVADHVGDYLFAPTENTVRQLENEGLPESRIYNTGNTIVDAVYQNKTLAENKSRILSSLGYDTDEFALFTLHRAENVDSKEVFENILKGVEQFATTEEVPVLYPAHPRSQNRIKEFEITISDCITVIDPVDYLDFLMLEAKSEIIFTDSGGIQEEACILQVPCVTVRTETERPETVDVGGNVVAGTEPEKIAESGREMLDKERNWRNPFGDGTASETILDVLLGTTNDG